MSIKLLKKLVTHEIKRFYVKNKLDRKDFIIDIEGLCSNKRLGQPYNYWSNN